MTYYEKQELQIMLQFFCIALMVGIFFGIWQESWAAGAFMTGFAFIMMKE